MYTHIMISVWHIISRPYVFKFYYDCVLLLSTHSRTGQHPLSLNAECIHWYIICGSQ